MLRGKKALVPFLTVGYPTRKRTLDLLRASADAGADAIELGIPFSDPLADGPIIQATSQKALQRGATPEDAFLLTKAFRRTHDTPLFVMTYTNPVLRYGANRFFRRCNTEGISGVILPDLPPEESAEFEGGCVPLVYLCSLTCREERLRKIARRSRPFVYLVSVKGVTGARHNLSPEVGKLVRRVRRVTRKPLYVGFGITSPEHARAVARVADGIIVGSAILRRADKSPREVGRFISSLRRAIDMG